MTRAFVAFFVTALLLVVAAPFARCQSTPAPDESATIGRAVPDVVLTDDTGRRIPLSSLAGKPIILSPIFTRCPHACQMITSSLRDALLAIGTPGNDYQIVTLTFDPADSLEVLREYRAGMDLPAGWIVARAEPAALDSLLDAVDFNYSPVTGGFLHANVVAFLTPDLRISGYVHGIAYDEDEIRHALLSAVAPDSLVRAFRPLIVAVAVAGVLVTLIVLRTTRRRPEA